MKRMWRHLAASSCAVPGSARSAATARPADLGSHSSAAGKRTWLFAKLQPHRQWGTSPSRSRALVIEKSGVDDSFTKKMRRKAKGTHTGNNSGCHKVETKV